MKVGSLFSGIVGLDRACGRAFCGETVWQVEGIDLSIALAAETQPVDRKTLEKLKSYARHGDFNRRVLARHWPEARQLCDVRTVGAHNLEPVDVIRSRTLAAVAVHVGRTRLIDNCLLEPEP